MMMNMVDYNTYNYKEVSNDLFKIYRRTITQIPFTWYS